MDERHEPWQGPAQSPAVTPQTQGGNKSWGEITGQPPATKQRHGFRKPLFMAVLAAALIAGSWYGIGRYEKYKTKHDFESKISNAPDIGNIPAARGASADTPLGVTVHGSGVAAGLDIKVARVISDPKTSGDAPDPGTRYLEVDLSVTNGGKSQAVVPGTFYYRIGAGKLINTATSTGKTPDYPNKDVQITGKESLDGLSLGGGQTDSAHYLIFQVPAPGKDGKLVWYDGYYDTDSTELGVFDLD